MKKVLITGADGFIGSHLLKQLDALPESSACEYHILLRPNALAHTSAASQTGVLADGRYHRHYFDISKPLSIDITFDDIVHLAALNRTNLGNDKSYDTFYHNNVQGVLNLCEGLRFKRFIFLSTANLYQHDHESLTEESPVTWTNHYEHSKYEAEQFLLKNHPRASVILRCVNTIGPGQKPIALIPHMIHNALRQLPLEIFVPHNRRIHCLDVRDVACALIAVISKPQHMGIFNLSSNTGVSISSIAQSIVDLTDSRSEIVYSNLAEERPYRVSNEKFCAHFSWQPRIDIQQSVSDTVAHILLNINEM